MSDQAILRKFFDAGQEWGERKTHPVSNQEAFDITLQKFGGMLACTVCYEILPVEEMYSVDACSEECQAKIDGGNKLPVPNQPAARTGGQEQESRQWQLT